jgi:pimeloyl-ACP methyl ester carboxylesterase
MGMARSLLRRTLGVALALAPVAAVSLVGVADAQATAAPAAVDSFYTAPKPLPAEAAGTVIRFRPATLNLGVGAPATRAWTVMYHSRTARNQDNAVTGTVITPTAAWTGTGSRPVISFAVGTQGMGLSCAPSKQLVAGTEYENTGIELALSQGWSVAVTDYEGYTNGSIPTYTAGRSEAHAVLDVVRAAKAIPGSNVTSTSPLALWGYSQGGGASAWAAALQPTYAPGLHLVADASGGVPADLKSVNADLNGNVGAAFMLYGLVGGAQAYPSQIPLYSEANATGLADFAAVKTQCVDTSLTAFPFVNLSSLLKGGKTLAQFESQSGVAAVLRQNNLGAAAAPKVPVFQYHASADEIVNVVQATALHQTWCSKGVKTTFTLVPGDHVAGDPAGAPAAVAFLSAEFAGKPFVSDCLP